MHLKGTTMIEIKLLQMSKEEFETFKYSEKLEWQFTSRDFIVDNGGNATYANMDYYKSPNGTLYKCQNFSKPIKSPQYRRDCMEDDIERLRINIRNLLKAIYQKQDAIELDRSVLKTKHPLDKIQERVKKDHDEKETATICTKITSDVLKEQFSLLAQNAQISEISFISQIFSTAEIQKLGYDILITALMQLQQFYTDDENQSE